MKYPLQAKRVALKVVKRDYLTKAMWHLKIHPWGGPTTLGWTQKFLKLKALGVGAWCTTTLDSMDQNVLRFDGPILISLHLEANQGVPCTPNLEIQSKLISEHHQGNSNHFDKSTEVVEISSQESMEVSIHSRNAKNKNQGLGGSFNHLGASRV